MELVRERQCPNRYTVTVPARLGGIDVIGYVVRYDGWWTPSDSSHHQIGDSRRTPREAARFVLERLGY